MGNGGRQTGSTPPLLSHWLPLGPFWPCSGKFLTCGNIMRQHHALYGKGAGQGNLLIEGERRAPAQLSSHTVLRKGPSLLRSLPPQSSTAHAALHTFTMCSTRSPHPGTAPQASLPRSPGRAVIYKELTPTLSSIDLIRQEDRSALGTAVVRKSGILWPLKGTPSACFCPLPRLLLCIDSNKSFH